VKTAEGESASSDEISNVNIKGAFPISDVSWLFHTFFSFFCLGGGRRHNFYRFLQILIRFGEISSREYLARLICENKFLDIEIWHNL